MCKKCIPRVCVCVCVCVCARAPSTRDLLVRSSHNDNKSFPSSGRSVKVSVRQRGSGFKTKRSNVRDWSRPRDAPPPPPPPPPPRCRPRPGRSRSVEHYGLGILVCHLRHVTKDIFFCDDTKQPPVGGAEEQRNRKEISDETYAVLDERKNNIMFLLAQDEDVI